MVDLDWLVSAFCAVGWGNLFAEEVVNVTL
jgi:hypothetical protein